MPELAATSTLSKYHVKTDEHDGKAVTFDYSETDISSVITPNSLKDSPIEAPVSGYSIVGASISTQGSPGNVLIDGAPQLEVGVNHWRFVGLPGSTGEYGCGISSLTGFGSGWRLNAFYLTSNGNLAGRGALRCGFVSNMPQLPIVDWILDVSGANVVEAYIFVNGEFKGHAGHLQFPSADLIHSLRPVVSFGDSSSDCRVAYISHVTMPSTSLAFLKEPVTPSSVFDCVWKLVKPQLTAPDTGIQLRVMQEGLSVKAFNSLRVGAEVDGDGSIRTKGPVSGTLMAVPPVFESTERQMMSMLESASRWTLDHESLIIESGAGSFTWEVSRPQPVTENPLLPESSS